MQEILRDEKQGKEIKWRYYKKESLEISRSYIRNGYENKGYRVMECGDYLEFKHFEDGSKKFVKSYFCKDRLCPMCSWRRSLKIFGQVSRVMDYITEKHDYRYIFLTLTVRNVEDKKLDAEIDILFKAFNLLTKRKEFKKVSKGWFRCLEVTHNWERKDYHPHFHMVIAVQSNYFEKSSIYMSQNAWCEMWQSCLDIDYKPIVDVRTVKDLTGQGNLGKAVAEVSKYAVKAKDMIVRLHGKVVTELTDSVVNTFSEALANRRLVAFGGLFKEVHKKLNLDDIESGDLVNTDNDDEIRADLNYILVRFKWNIGHMNYYLHKEREL